MKTLIKNATIVNEGEVINGHIVIVDDIIESVAKGQPQATETYDEVIDAGGSYVLPGVIDEHVHFREPGLTHKADIESETRAAAAGGVTSFFDMPNTNPPTTSVQAVEDKYALAATKSHVNYGFFIGATNDNVDELTKVDPHSVPGVKLFMGSSTGNMLVDNDAALEEIFSKVKLPIMAHCEDTGIINKNMAEAKNEFGDDPDICHHPEIRDVYACAESTNKALQLAYKYKSRLHLAHVSTEFELMLLVMANLSIGVTAEACVGHLLFESKDYDRMGSLIKVNPSIKEAVHRKGLRSLTFSKNLLEKGNPIKCIATDHAPHLLSEKQGGCVKAASGMPMIQFSLPAMMEFVDNKKMKIERLVELMCHNPAKIFEVDKRGFLRPGYKADITIIKRDPWIVTKDCILSKCGWSPLQRKKLHWRVVRTICNGHTVYQDGKVDTEYIGERLTFRH